VHNVGNTVVDALCSIPDAPDFTLPNVPQNSRLVLVTTHRRENHDQLANICQGLLKIRDENPDIEIVFPVHLNPNVQKVVQNFLSGQPRIHLLPPLDYFDFVQLMRRTYLILTDSGGVQEEAPTYKIPTLVLRRQTERPEAVHAGLAKLVGTDVGLICSTANTLLQDKDAYAAMQQGENPFGDGQSSTRIAQLINAFLN